MCLFTCPLLRRERGRTTVLLPTGVNRGAVKEVKMEGQRQPSLGMMLTGRGDRANRSLQQFGRAQAPVPDSTRSRLVCQPSLLRGQEPPIPPSEDEPHRTGAGLEAQCRSLNQAGRMNSILGPGLGTQSLHPLGALSWRHCQINALAILSGHYAPEPSRVYFKTKAAKLDKGQLLGRCSGLSSRSANWEMGTQRSHRKTCQ